jgi:adenine-specific DNA-methyltransferase
VSVITSGPVKTTIRASYGEVFTRRWVVETLLDLIGYNTDSNLADRLLVEPAAGSGAFLVPAVERLLTSSVQNGRPVEELGEAIRAYDLQPRNVERCQALCRGLLESYGADSPTAAKLARTWVRQADFLLDVEPVEADFVVGNPPYIRIEDLPTEISTAYRTAWTTMTGRADVYVGFLERSLSMLKPDGRVGFICADRWMRNQYGASLRALIASDFAVEHVWTMHDVDAFEAKVSAYPAIVVLHRGAQGSAVVADTTEQFGPNSAAELRAWTTAATATTDFASRGVAAHRLPHWFPGSELWPSGTPGRLALIEHLNDHFAPLHDPANGTKVSIGVATGADDVYVVRDPTLVEPDRALRLSMVRDLSSGHFKWTGNYLVNPWAEDGSLVDLVDFPRLSSYLSSAGPQLRGRHTAKKAPHAWHRTIDKVHHDLIAKPKLLIQDMRTSMNPVLEPGGHYPHHNLYYIVSDSWDMEVLGGLLLSQVAQAFVEAYGVRMRGGTLRFQSQYLKLIRVPDFQTIDDETQEALRLAFRTRDPAAATLAAAIAYEINLADYDLVREGSSHAG